MEEIEDKVKDTFAEHQFKFETVQIMADELSDLSGANKPVEVKLIGPDHLELRRLAEQLGETLEKKGKGRGIKEVNSNVRGGNPDLMVVVDTALRRASSAWKARPSSDNCGSCSRDSLPRRFPNRPRASRV